MNKFSQSQEGDRAYLKYSLFVDWGVECQIQEDGTIDFRDRGDSAGGFHHTRATGCIDQRFSFCSRCLFFRFCFSRVALGISIVDTMDLAARRVTAPCITCIFYRCSDLVSTRGKHQADAGGDREKLEKEKG